MIESIEGIKTDYIKPSHNHYWIRHKMGYLFCACGYLKVGRHVWKPDDRL